MSLCPWLRSPFTDMTAYMGNHQWAGRCAKIEMKMLDCLEAYGLDKGMLKCTVLIDDFIECHNLEKQKRRTFYMRWERDRQYWSGERCKADRYATPPKWDSYFP